MGWYSRSGRFSKKRTSPYCDLVFDRPPCTRLTVKLDRWAGVKNDHRPGPEHPAGNQTNEEEGKMSIKGKIKQIAFAVCWCLVGAGAIVLLLAAINRKNSRRCSRCRIEINQGGGQLFLDQKDVLNLLTSNGKEKLTGRTIMSYDLRGMEDLLRKNVWVRDAQLFFDNNEVLRIRVTERLPVARVFANTGLSFYVDSSGGRLPLSEKASIKLPVFTNYPALKPVLRGGDSALLFGTRDLATFLLANPFWMAEIEQINVTGNRSFQMVPVIGNHVIEFGDATECALKFHKLYLFYREVLSRTGFDRYATIDLRFSGQVIGTKKGNYVSRADSLQAIRNIQQLIRSGTEIQADTVKQQEIKPLEHNTITEQTLSNYDLVPGEEDSAAVRPKKGKKIKK
jgi:cell division protein FtsQ